MRKKVLFLSSRLPFPLISGERVKNYNLLNVLSKHFKVHFVSLTDEDIPKDFFNWAQEKNISYRIFKKPKISYLKNLPKAVFNREPLQVSYFYFKDVQKYIDSIYKDFDLLFPTLIRTAKYVWEKDKPKIIDFADSIAQNYLKSKEKTKSPFWKIVYEIEGKRLLEFEKKCIEQFDRAFLFNIEEVQYFNSPKVQWMPHGVKEELLTYNKNTDKYKNWIVFFGKMDYQPNVDAVLWFKEHVLPYINPEITFAIVGARPTEKIKRIENEFENVKVFGFVNDPYEMLRNSMAVVAPMQTGGGIQNKLLEAMAVEGLVITTSLSARPIVGAKNKEHFLVEDSPKGFAETINKLYETKNRHENIRKKARDFIKNNFTWEIYEKKLLTTIEKILRGKE